MKTVSIIRNRGQLTIPDGIRKTVRWVSPMSAVTLTVVTPDEIIIKPHQVKVDWDEIWRGIEKARSIKSDGSNGSLSNFIVMDRYNH